MTAQKSKFRFLEKYGLFGVLILLVIFFSIANPHFLSTENLINIARQSAILGISAVGMTFVLLTGGIDLTVGSILSLVSIICAKLMVEAGFPPILAVSITLAVVCLFGVFNAFIITQIGIPPLITTLGMMSTLRGISYVLCKGRSVWDFPEKFKIIGQGYVGIIPIPVIIMIVIFILGWIFLNKTVYGRWIYGIGANEEAARLSGINVKRMKYLVYTLCSLFTGIAGIILLSRLSSGQPKVGTGFELNVITVVVLGGVSIFGGEGNLVGVIWGLLIVGVLNNGMIILNLSDYYQKIVVGLVLIAAVSFDVLLSKKRKSESI